MEVVYDTLYFVGKLTFRIFRLAVYFVSAWFLGIGVFLIFLQSLFNIPFDGDAFDIKIILNLIIAFFICWISIGKINQKNHLLIPLSIVGAGILWGGLFIATTIFNPELKYMFETPKYENFYLFVIFSPFIFCSGIGILVRLAINGHNENSIR